MLEQLKFDALLAVNNYFWFVVCGAPTNIEKWNWSWSLSFLVAFALTNYVRRK